MSSSGSRGPRLTRRQFVAALGTASLLLRPSPFFGAALTSPAEGPGQSSDVLSFEDERVRYVPRYPSPSPLEDLFHLVPPGSDEYIEEKYAAEIGATLRLWALALKKGDYAGVLQYISPSLKSSLLAPIGETKLRLTDSIETAKRAFSRTLEFGPDSFLKHLQDWIGRDAHIETSNFEITAIEQVTPEPLRVRTDIRFEIVIRLPEAGREQRVGSWLVEWICDTSAEKPSTWRAAQWQVQAESSARMRGPAFIDVTEQALGGTSSYKDQMSVGSDHWRTVLDGACGIDVYGNNGVAVGDFDGDGYDDLYVSQPAGLPNRLYRNRGNGTFEDVTETAGVGVLDNTSCALFADLRNTGLQDLLVVCGNGPLLFLNQGNGTFLIKHNAFEFAQVPQGTFTHAAIADYDRDGRLDIYFCLYSYYLGLDQYHYPVPYFDARNGPPNFLFHNEGNATFTDRTHAAGLSVDNDRYSFACSWGESSSNNLPDLYVVNDFGRSNFYRNRGDGTFTSESTKASVEDVGAGMSASWADFNNDGHADLYAANMWSASGQRVSQQKRFHQNASQDARESYQRHAQGNALYQNLGDGRFRNITQQAGVGAGRWAWCSDAWDFDHDGFQDLYVTNGYISAAEADGHQTDLGSFFWRQVVGKSPEDATPSLAYERGWNALNELIRSDNSWSGFERNVMFANNRDGTFTDVSGLLGLDFLQDSRSFALSDFDGDGRLEVVLKNRNAPQLRLLHNAMTDLGDAIAFRLRGIKSNRDAIGASITVEAGDLRQTKYLQAGSGFLAQHSKQVFFGLGKSTAPVKASIRWPSGLVQQFGPLSRNNTFQVEEGRASIVAKPFGPTAAAYGKPAATASSSSQEPSPKTIGTWLIDPLQAPAFSLLDLAGQTHTLQELRGRYVLLCFGAAASSTSQQQRNMLNTQNSEFVARGIQVVALDLPAPANKISGQQNHSHLTFPLLLATDEIAGIYNVIFRYLFDRRRDLAIPTSFLLDKEGKIVKVYQGAIGPKSVMEDVVSIPTTAVQRKRKALPFDGKLHQSDFVRNDFTYGVAMFQHGYLDQAEESFRQVVIAKPDNAEGYYNLGTLNLRKKNFAQARTYLGQTIKLKPDYPEAWNNLGMMAAQEGHMDQAISNFQQSLQLRPTYATALLNLGNVYRRQGDTAKAGDCLRRALNLQPDDPEANYSLGMFYAQQNQLPDAQDYLQKAITLRPNYPEALNNLGVLFVRDQNYSKAEQLFRSIIQLAPGFDQSYINLARLYVVQHDLKQARETLQNLLRVKPDSSAGKQGLQMLDATP